MISLNACLVLPYQFYSVLICQDGEEQKVDAISICKINRASTGLYCIGVDPGDFDTAQIRKPN